MHYYHTPESKIDVVYQGCDPVFSQEIEEGKLQEVKALAEERNPELLIEVDGGITVDNVQDVLDAGANVVVAGSAVFKGDKKANIAAFMEKLNA